jgi:NitT/TauT family transport system ATP-binding protein
MLTVDQLGHTYRARGRGHDHQALDSVTFTVAAGELVCVVGPSGCGKTTLLRAVAGLVPPISGLIAIDGEPIRGVPGGIALVAQDYSTSLLPWLTAMSNVEFGLTPLRLPRAERRRWATEALAAVGLADAGHKRPWQLSGGMAQRAAIARAIARRPRLLLMDEPFASVDAQTRADLEDLLLAVQREHGMTVLLVTHDIDEAVYLGHRVLVLSGPPSRVLADLTIDLPLNRDQICTRQDPAFVRHRSEIARLIRVPLAQAATVGLAVVEGRSVAQ